MAGNAEKTEHAGPKKGDGAYWGRKAAAKHESDKARRANGRKAAREGVEETK